MSATNVLVSKVKYCLRIAQQSSEAAVNSALELDWAKTHDHWHSAIAAAQSAETNANAALDCARAEAEHGIIGAPNEKIDLDAISAQLGEMIEDARMCAVEARRRLHACNLALEAYSSKAN